ncbi:EF-P beta-lysylation protein EpmB [Halioxenophilus aromaticivorans]|uniref:L-lysine 2,3-aminomutase n=1 Tax=Halioxenophilus aromaticivorans TaxID=1306992 RepID=A0AAV3U3U1_9ALTE
MHIITDGLNQTNSSWQQQLNDLITQPAELAELLQLPYAAVSQAAGDQFELRLPRRMLDKIEPGNLDDPILRQFLPQAQELTSPPDYSSDPLDETSTNPVPGLIHKYHGRVLITATGQCAVNCRYCFRRHFNYQENRLRGPAWQGVLDYLAADDSINEVIFSGGDPLSVSNNQLARWFSDLTKIAHLKRLRIHSRLPVVIPSRIDQGLIHTLQQAGLQCVLVIHCNHPREVDGELRQGLSQLQRAGVQLFNQTVLLNGVNNCADTLVELSESLFDCGVHPYYLHLLDRVQGAAHFDVDEGQAQQLHQQMRARLPGFLVPKLVRETPGQPNKTWLHI